jgi:hypothetical protein
VQVVEDVGWRGMQIERGSGGSKSYAGIWVTTV